MDLKREFFCPYEIADAVTKLEFKESCFGVFIERTIRKNKSGAILIKNDEKIEVAFDTILCNAPIYDQVKSFLLEKFNIIILPIYSSDNELLFYEINYFDNGVRVYGDIDKAIIEAIYLINCNFFKTKFV